MSHQWYSPDKQWPPHGGTRWNDSLRAARAAGWHLLKYEGHTWGVVVCRKGTEEACVMPIFATARASENVAKDLAKLVRDCAHRADIDVTARGQLARAEQLLDGAQRLLDAAAKCYEAEALRARASELLDLAESNLEAAEVIASEHAEVHLEDAIRYEERADHVEAAARLDAAAAGYPYGERLEADALVSTARARLDQAAALVGPADTTEFRARLATLRQQVTAMRTDL